MMYLLKNIWKLCGALLLYVMLIPCVLIIVIMSGLGYSSTYISKVTDAIMGFVCDLFDL